MIFPKHFMTKDYYLASNNCQRGLFSKGIKIARNNQSYNSFNLVYYIKGEITPRKFKKDITTQQKRGLNLLIKLIHFLN